jgi:ribosomal protein S18 acetylase RimI-like enzyme
MVRLYPAASLQQYHQLLALIYHQKTDFLEPKLDLIELTWEQFCTHFIQTGAAFAVEVDGQLAGMCWTQLSEQVVTVLGLVICPEKRGLGIGTAVLLMLENQYAGQANWIELQVHISNHGARRLYERLGYRVVNDCQDDCFLHMRKALRKKISYLLQMPFWAGSI